MVTASLCAMPATGSWVHSTASTGACVILLNPADSIRTEVILPAFGCKANISFAQCLPKSSSTTAGLASLTVRPAVSEVA